MSGCASDQQLARLVDERLAGPELAELEAHLEVCLSCRQRLEERARLRLWNLTEPAMAYEPGLPGGVAGATSVHLEIDLTREAFDHEQVKGMVHDTALTVRRTPSEFSAAHGADPERTFDRGDHDRGSPATGSGVRATRGPKIPGYEILHRLGEGGMGVVYKARHLGLNRLVALKMIRGGSEASIDHFKRFAIEAEAVARLHHPNILQIFDSGEADGLPFVSLELLEGGNLANRMSGTPQPWRAAAELLHDLAGAVHTAHQAGIIHRDLKPTNVMFAADGTPKITDFGLAKLIDSDDAHTKTGQIMGSPSYMAPEQAQGHAKRVGPAADVYALGAILYEALTGRPPFKGSTAMDTVRQVIEGEPVPPSRLVPRLPRDLETVCLKCLNKEPHKRYDSAQALAADLRQYLDGEPIAARPTSVGERAIKWARRRPLRAAALVFIPLLTLVAIGAEFRHEQFIIERQTAGIFLMEKSDAASSQAELEAAQLELAEFSAGINTTRRLAPLVRRVAAKRQRIADRLAALQAEQARRYSAQVERERLEKFRTLRNATQVYAAHLTVLDPAEHQKVLIATALAALAVYGQDHGAPASAWRFAAPGSEALEASEIAEIKESCYVLLLTLSEAENPAEGLKILDRAAQLRSEPTTAYHMLRAFCLGGTGDKAGQAREEQRARETKPATAFDHLLIGRVQFARSQAHGPKQPTARDDREAIRSCQAAIRLDPDQFGAQLLLAVIYFNSDRFSEAKTSLNSCIRMAPDLIGLYLFRALISGAEGNRALRKVKDRMPDADDWKAEAAEYFQAALEDYARVLELNPDANFRYVMRVNRGGMKLEAGQVEEAKADLEAAVALNPALYQAHALLAQVYLELGRLEEAARSLDRAIERQPDLPKLFRARALLFARSREKGNNKFVDVTPAQSQRAISDMKRAIDLEQNDPSQAASDYVEMGRLLFASGQTQEALAACDAALRLMRDDLKALRLRAVLLLELERYNDLLAASDAVIARGRPSADMLALRGQARVEGKDFSGAISDYTVALSLTPASSSLLDQRGWAYLFTDAFNLAVADFDAAIKLDPELSHAFNGRGLARVRLGRWRDAVSDAETAVRLASDKQKHRAYFNAARVNALALKYAVDEAGRQGEAGAALYRRLRSRAGSLLTQSVRQLPPDKQPAFWRDIVASDPVLRPFLP